MDEFKKKKFKKQLIERYKEKPSRLLGSNQFTPKVYNKFDQQPNVVDIQKFLQSGDPLGGSANTVKEGAREELIVPSIPNTALSLKVWTAITQSDGRVIDLTHSDFNQSTANVLKQRVAVWSSSRAGDYKTVYAQYRGTSDSSTHRALYTTEELESDRGSFFDGDSVDVGTRQGTYLWDDTDFTVSYNSSGSSNYKWIMMQREDNDQLYMGYYADGKLRELPVPSGASNTPATASIFRIDDGAGNIVNDGSDGFTVGYTAVTLTRTLRFDRASDSTEITINGSDTGSLQPAAFKCVAQLDDYRGGGKSGFSAYGILTSELPLQTGSADAGTIIRSVGNNKYEWEPASVSFTGVFEADRADMQEDGTNTDAIYIISASSGVVHEIYRIDDKSNYSGVRTVNDGSDGLDVCS